MSSKQSRQREGLLQLKWSAYFFSQWRSSQDSALHCQMTNGFCIVQFVPFSSFIFYTIFFFLQRFFLYCGLFGLYFFCSLFFVNIQCKVKGTKIMSSVYSTKSLGWHRNGRNGCLLVGTSSTSSLEKYFSDRTSYYYYLIILHLY